MRTIVRHQQAVMFRRMLQDGKKRLQRSMKPLRVLSQCSVGLPSPLLHEPHTLAFAAKVSCGQFVPLNFLTVSGLAE